MVRNALRWRTTFPDEASMGETGQTAPRRRPQPPIAYSQRMWKHSARRALADALGHTGAARSALTNSAFSWKFAVLPLCFFR